MRFREKLLRNERNLKGNNVPRVCPSPWPSPGSLRSSPMRQDALGGLARRYWAVNPARKPRTAPFEGRQSLLSNGNHGGAIWFRFDPLDGKMRFSRRLLTIALQGARGSRDGRAKVDPRQDSRQGAQARGRGHAQTGESAARSRRPALDARAPRRVPARRRSRGTLLFRPRRLVPDRSFDPSSPSS